MEDRVISIIDHLINSARLQKNEDMEVCLRVIKGAIERDCLSELADKCIEFTEKKATERMILEN